MSWEACIRSRGWQDETSSIFLGFSAARQPFEIGLSGWDVLVETPLGHTTMSACGGWGDIQHLEPAA